MEQIRVLAPEGLLGYGFPVKSFQEGLKRKPHVIAVDGGSTDPGPYYLGAGISFTDKTAVKRDLEILLAGALEIGIPLIIGSAGGSGAKPHLKWTEDIIKEIVKDKGYSFKMAVISADIEKPRLLESLKAGKIKQFESRKELTKEDIEETTYITGQMGVEPYIKALDMGAQVIVAGRSYDPAQFAAMPIKEGFDPGLAIHMSKVLECGAIASVPGSAADCLLGTLDKDSFTMEPTNFERKCTEVSVAAHTLYEKGHPVYLPGPGGMLDLENVKFQQMTDRTVKVSGSKFIKSDRYAIKIEGAKLVGYRTLSIAGARCPYMIKQIDSIIAGVKERVYDVFRSIPRKDYKIIFHVYGKNGVMSDLEPQKEITSHELGIVMEVIAKTQELANTICSVTRSTMLHYGYPGRIATAGNLAFPYSPSDMKAGEVYKFSIYHLLEVDDPCELFPISIIDFKGGK